MRFETQHFGSEIDMSALGEVTERVEIQLRLPYILVTVCTDIVTVRIRIAYSKSTAILAHGFNSCGYRTYW